MITLVVLLGGILTGVVATKRKPALVPVPALSREAQARAARRQAE